MLNLSAYDDQRLLSALNEGSDKAFRILFNRHWHKVYEAAHRKINSKEIAEEIAQDIFTSLWDKRGTLAINDFTHYLMAAVKYKSIDFIRHKIKRQEYWGYYKAFIPTVDNATEKMVEFDDLMGTLEEGMKKIPEKSKKIFYLHKLEGKSVKEISARFHLSEKAIEYHLTRSLKEMKLHLKDFIAAVLLFLVQG